MVASRRIAVGAAMGPIRKSQLPGQALLRRYEQGGHYTDCYSTDIARSVSHSQFVAAFYTTFLFKMERLILKWALSRPSTDAEARQLAEQRRDNFAAWNVEARDDDQLLLCDFQGKTRSWLMVEALSTGQSPQTRLFFGSAVVRTRTGKEESRAFGFSPLLQFHKLYSVALLYFARRRLGRGG